MLLKVNAAELQRRREKQNMTPYRLAVEAGLPVNAIYLRAREIAKALHCKTEEIFTEAKGEAV